MKKILALLLGILVVFTLPVTASASYLKDIVELKEGPYTVVYDDVDDNGAFLPEYVVDSDGNRVKLESAPIPDNGAYLPSSYDLRDYGYVTSVKNQAAAGACWAFAAISSFESSMIKQGYETKDTADYSEAHLTWFGHRQLTTNTEDPTYGDGYNLENPFANGGGWMTIGSTLFRGSGLQIEKNAPWIESNTVDKLLEMSQSESDRYESHARYYQAKNIYDNSIYEAKRCLMEYGNLELAYFERTDGYNSINSCFYQNIEESANHAVAVVGWDDNFSRHNFNEDMKPEKDGAWLVKGSWGINHGDEGYYWISYYDTSVAQMMSYIIAPEDVYDNIYQYDGGITETIFSRTSTLATANRFKATKNEILSHVGYYNQNEKLINLKVEIYVSDKGYSVPSSDNPTENMHLVSSATTMMNNVYRGYYTIELNNEVLLQKGDYFTVKVTVTDPKGGNVYIACEGEGNDECFYSSNEKESFMLWGERWYDCNSIGGRNCNNVPIKAFTQNVAPTLSHTLTYDANGGKGAPGEQVGATAYTVRTVKPTKFAHEFLGWSEDTNATSPDYVGGDIITLTEDTTLYAVWKKTQAIELGENLSVEIDEQYGAVLYEFTPSLTSVYVIESIGSVDSKVKLYNSEGTLLLFDDDSGDELNFKLDCFLIEGNTYYIEVGMYENSIEIYEFSVNIKTEYEGFNVVTYNINDGSAEPIVENVPLGDYVFLFTPEKSFTLKYNLNGGSGMPSSQEILVTCVGWSTDSNATSATYSCGDYYNPEDDVVLYAVWEECLVDIPETVPEKNNFEFLGWSESRLAKTGEYMPGDSITISENTTLYAIWKETGSVISNVQVEDCALLYNDEVPLEFEVNGTDEYSVVYESSDESVAVVDENGCVKAVGSGTVEIIVTVTDSYGNVTDDTCTVTVEYAWWQWLILIFLFGWIWY